MFERWRASRNPSNLDDWGLKCSGNQGASIFRYSFYPSEVWCQCWKVLIMLIITKFGQPRRRTFEDFQGHNLFHTVVFHSSWKLSLDLLPGVFVPKNFQIGRNSCRWARNPEPPHSQIRKTQHDKRSRFQPGTQRHPSKDVFFRGLLHGIKEASTTDTALQVSMPIALWNNIAKHERTSSHIWCNVSSLNFHEVSNSSKWGNEAYQAHEVEIWFGRGSLKISRSQRFTPSLCLKNTSNNISWSGNKRTNRFCWQKSSSTVSACTIEDIVHHISHLLLRSACFFSSPRGDCHRTGRNK